MSTQGIRNIILRLKEEYGDTILPGQAAAIALAEKEVEAIETTAKSVLMFALNPGAPGALEKWNTAADVLQSIAEDAP